MSRPVACFAHFIYVDLINLTISGAEYNYSFEVKEGGICYAAQLSPGTGIQ